MPTRRCSPACARRSGRRVPLVATFDIHANLSPALFAAADVLIGYDTYPHTDMAARGREAAACLAGILASGRRPAKAFRKLPLLTVPQVQATAEPPMRAVIARAARARGQPEVLTASVAVGFPYADVPQLGRRGGGLWRASRRGRGRGRSASPRALGAPRTTSCRAGAGGRGGPAGAGRAARAGRAGRRRRQCRRRRAGRRHGHPRSRCSRRARGTRSWSCGRRRRRGPAPRWAPASASAGRSAAATSGMGRRSSSRA